MVIVKAYGSLSPASAATLAAVQAALSSWYLCDAAELKGDLLRISHEGEYFPADDVMEALHPFITTASEGKLDIIDLEAWTLRRFLFHLGGVSERSASLDHALEACQK